MTTYNSHPRCTVPCIAEYDGLAPTLGTKLRPRNGFSGRIQVNLISLVLLHLPSFLSRPDAFRENWRRETCETRFH